MAPTYTKSLRLQELEAKRSGEARDAALGVGVDALHLAGAAQNAQIKAQSGQPLSQEEQEEIQRRVNGIRGAQNDPRLAGPVTLQEPSEQEVAEQIGGIKAALAVLDDQITYAKKKGDEVELRRLQGDRILGGRQLERWELQGSTLKDKRVTGEKQRAAMESGPTFDGLRSVNADVPDDVWQTIRGQFGKPTESGAFFGMNEAQQAVAAYRGVRDKQVVEGRRVQADTEKVTERARQAEAVLPSIPQAYREQARKRILAGENASTVKNDIDAQQAKQGEEKPAWTPGKAKDAVLKIVNDPFGQEDATKRRALANLGADALDFAYPYVGQPVRDMIDSVREAAGGGSPKAAPSTAPSIGGPRAVERWERGPDGKLRKVGG